MPLALLEPEGTEIKLDVRSVEALLNRLGKTPWSALVVKDGVLLTKDVLLDRYDRVVVRTIHHRGGKKR